MLSPAGTCSGLAVLQAGAEVAALALAAAIGAIVGLPSRAIAAMAVRARRTAASNRSTGQPRSPPVKQRDASTPGKVVSWPSANASVADRGSRSVNAGAAKLAS